MTTKPPAASAIAALYDRDVNRVVGRRSSQDQFQKAMLDVEYMRSTLGPSNEHKV